KQNQMERSPSPLPSPVLGRGDSFGRTWLSGPRSAVHHGRARGFYGDDSNGRMHLGLFGIVWNRLGSFGLFGDIRGKKKERGEGGVEGTRRWRMADGGWH